MKLPIELYVFIFRCLGLKDLARLRRVCKLWKSEIDRIRIRELVIVNERESYNYWNFTGQPVNPANLIELDIFDHGYREFRKQLTNLQLLSGLKRLKIASLGAVLKGDSFYIYLTKFRSLDELEIEYPLDEFQTICHPNLKRLYIEYIDEEIEENSVEIDCPRLEALKFSGYFYPIDLTYPETLVYLASDFLGFDGEKFDLKPFKSIEYLFQDCINHDAYFTIPSIELSKHPQLKTFKFRNLSLNQQDYYYVKERLVNLIEQKERLRRSDFAIHFNGTLLTSEAQLNEFGMQYGITQID